MKKSKAVAYGRMWPRELFSCKDGTRLLVRTKMFDDLNKPGVYVLYRDGIPYYVGKADKLFTRIWSHANQPGGRYYNFWNHFSFFVVEDSTWRSRLEGILIAAMPTVNSSKPKITKVKLPSDIWRKLHKLNYGTIQLKSAVEEQ